MKKQSSADLAKASGSKIGQGSSLVVQKASNSELIHEEDEPRQSRRKSKTPVKSQIKVDYQRERMSKSPLKIEESLSHSPIASKIKVVTDPELMSMTPIASKAKVNTEAPKTPM